jgi:hypothetical protein
LIGGFAGCVSAQMSLQGADFEHGAPGIGAYLLLVMIGRSAFGAAIGAVVGALIAASRAGKSE